MKENKSKDIKVIKDFTEVEIRDYRTPNKHYHYLKDQFVSSESFNEIKSNIRHSLNDQYDSRLTYL